MTENELSKLIVDLCYKIHKRYGPGLFENVYEEIFCYEWIKTNIPFSRQQEIVLVHEEIKLGVGFRADVIIDNKVLIEFKSIESLSEVHYKQVANLFKPDRNKIGTIGEF